MFVCFLESLYVTMSEQCKKERSFKLLCAVFIREGEFGFGWAIWTALAHFEAAAVVTVIHTAKCQKLFYKA